MAWTCEYQAPSHDPPRPGRTVRRGEKEAARARILLPSASAPSSGPCGLSPETQIISSLEVWLWGWLEPPVRSQPHPSRRCLSLILMEVFFRLHLSTSSTPEAGTVTPWPRPPLAAPSQLSAHHDARAKERVVQPGEVPKRRNENGRSCETPCRPSPGSSSGGPCWPRLQPIAREASAWLLCREGAG